MSRFLRVFAIFFGLIFAGNAFAAGYTCDSLKTYTSCNAGYFMSGTTCTKCGTYSSTDANNTSTSCTCNDGYTTDGAPAGSSNTTTTTAACTGVATTITLNGNGATTAGTTAIYGRYGVSMLFLDSARSQAMSSGSGNTITAPSRAHKVTYNANGGTVTTSSATATYTFNGYWSASSGGTQYIGTSGYPTSAGYSAAMALKANATWYAQWTGGSVTLPTPTKAGCKFNGWSTSSTATSGTTGSYTPTSNVTLYATWACMSISAGTKTLTYNGSAQSCANVTAPTGATITYSASSGGTYDETEPTLTDFGSKTVYYKVSATGYTDFYGSYFCAMQKASSTITVKEGSTTLATGSTLSLTYPTAKSLSVTCSNGATPTASGDTTAYVTVSSSGSTVTLTPAAVGDGTIVSISCPATTNYLAASAGYTVNVANGTISATISGNRKTYDGSALTCDGGITVSSPSGATVNYASGGVDHGTTPPSRTNAGTTQVSYSISAPNYTTKSGTFNCVVAQADNPITIGGKVSATGTVTFPSGATATVSNASGGTLSVTTSDSSIATASVGSTTATSTTLTITAKAQGTATITVTSAATTNYKAGSATYAITINPGTISATVNNNSQTYNGSELTCDGDITGLTPSGATVQYATQSSGTCGSYGSAPTRTAAGTTTVCYKISAANYTDKTGTFTCTVDKAANTLTLSASSGNMAYSTTKTFTVSNNTSGGALSVATSNSDVATATISGTTVTITSKTGYGAADITVTSAATSNYNSASAKYRITVDLGTITLNNQSANTAGTTAIYQKYNTNVYLDSARSKAMTASANPITIPKKSGVTFKGYYSATSGGTQYINANGYITSDGLAAGKALKANGTWYAQWSTCPAGSVCNGSSVTTCPEGSFCPEGSNSATKCPGLYVNSAAGSDANTDCYFTTTAGKYMVAATDTAQTTCPAKQYCTAETLYYPNVSVLNDGGWNDCPAISGRQMTTIPDNYRVYASDGTTVLNTSVTIYSAVLQSWTTGMTAITYCRAVYGFQNEAGIVYDEGVKYNASTGKYDIPGSATYYSKVNPGYYVKERYSATRCNNSSSSMIYKKAVVCPAGSYCPGLTSMPACSSGISYTDEGLGKYSCADETTNYASSAEKSTSINSCYLTTTSTKFVKTEKSGEETCTAGGYCPGSVTVYYGSTGGRTACGAGTANANTGSSAASACTSCAAGTYSTGNASSCSTITEGCYGGAGSVKACPNSCSALNAFYTKSDSGRDTNADCYGTTAATKYVAEAGKGQVACTGGYCPGGTKVYYATGNGSTTGGRNTLSNWTCPDSSDAAADCYRGVTLNKNNMSGTLALPSSSGCRSIGGATGTTADTVYVYYGVACKLPTTALSGSATGTTYTGTTTWATSANAASGFVSSITLTDTSSTTPVRYAGKKYTCSGGYYLKASTNGACTACPDASYCVGISDKYYSTSAQGLSACSALDSTKTDGTYSSVSPRSANTHCRFTQNQQTVTEHCASKTSNTMSYSGSAWPANTYAVTAEPGSIIVNNNTSSASCSQCTGATYSAGGTAATCSFCDSNYRANTTAGKSSATQCQISCGAGQAVLEKNAACAIVTGNNYKTGTALVNYGSTSPTASDKTSGWAVDTIYACPSSYSISGTAAGNHDARTDCTISCAKGTQVVSANAACTTPSGTTWYTAAHSVSAGSTSGSNVKSCNTGYATANTTTATDHDEAADCKIGCSAGYYIPTAGEGCKVCTAGKYCSAISGIAQTSTSAVTGNVTAGYWNNGGGTNATGSVISGYSGGTIAAGYYGGAGATSSTGSGTVSGGYYSTGGGASATPTSAGTGCLSSFKCGKLSAAYYSNGGSTADGATCVSGKTCGTCDSNYRANAATGKTAVTQCETQCAAGTAVLTENNACATIQNSTYKGKYTAQHNVAYGSKSDISTCPTYYQDGNGAAGQANCINSCAAGTQVASANADCTTPNTANWYTDAHDVTYGKTSANLSKVIACDSDYANSGTTAVNHAGVTSCKVTCAPGTYVESNGAACTDVGSGYYRSGTETVSQTKTGTRNACTDLGAIYKASDAGRDASTDCYATTTAKSYVKTAKDATETSCLAGSYCPGSVKVYYSSTGGSVQCVTGSYSASGASSCTACGSGTTTSGAGQSSCNATCSNNNSYDAAWATATWNTNNTMTNLCTISKCGAGSKYASANGGSCTACAVGTYQSSTSHTTTSCTSADKGYFVSSEGASSQTKCTAGKACTTTGLSAPDATCTAGYYCPEGSSSAKQNQCTANSSSAAGADAISDCSCNAGYGGNAGTSGGACTFCSAGTYKSSAGNTSCSACTANYYCTGGTNRTACVSPYTKSAASSDDENDCYLTTSATKYVKETGAGEVSCPAESYCAGGSTIYKGGSVSGRSTTGGSTLCPAGKFCVAGVSAGTECVLGSYSAAGASACTACQDGKTTSAKGATSCNATCSNATGVSDWETASWATTNTMTNLCTIAATAGCSANYYKNSNACSTCSSGTNSKYTLSAAGTTSVNSCYLKTTEGKYVATKGAGETACISPYYCPGGTTIYYGTGTTTGGNSTCTGLGAIYKASDAGASKNTQCYATTSAGKYVTAKATSEVACPAGDWCAGSVKVYYGSAGGNTDCPSGYTSGTTGYSAQSQCLMSVAGGKYVATEKESSASGTCAAGYYKPAHTVNYGGTSSCSACTGATYQPSTGQASCLSCPAATNDTANVSSYSYWNGGSTGDHTVRSGCNVTFKSKTLDDGVMTAYSCYVDTGADTYGIDGTSKTCWVNRTALTCNGGYYNSTFNNSSTATQYTSNKTLTDLYANVCQAVGTGYYSANDALTRTACSTGLVTCGSGACANEADDCGRKLHMGANTIYLRSAKRGTPALNVKIGDKTFYGVLSTSLSSKAKVKNGTTTYSVVNDNQ